MATVQLRGVSKTYDAGANAVRAIDLEVKSGEFLVLVGPSGCGKSTTLRLIAGLEEATAGEIWIDGRVVNHVPPKDRNIAMVFQNYALYPHMNVYRNMAFGLELRYRSDWWSRGWLAITQPTLAAELSSKRSEIPGRIQQTAEMLGIDHLLQRMPSELSGGEKQRVALGRAIVRQPAAFLFDEPLSNLDAKLRGDMRRELRRLHERLAATMIYVTHDQIEAMTLGDRLVVMQQGTIRQIGTPGEVYDAPADKFVAQFIGSPPMNLLAGTLDDQGTWTRTVNSEVWRLPTTTTVRPPAASQEVILGVRPEHVEVLPSNNESCWPGRVVGLENLGDVTHLELEIAGNTIITAKHAGRFTPPADGRVSLRFQPERLHWFDATTEQRIHAV